MKEFKNTMVGQYAYKSQFVMSWIYSGGQLDTYKSQKLFKEWLWSLGLSSADVQDIYEFATNGKLELQNSARRFLQSKEEP